MAESLFSIVIPVHNKAVLTRQCLDSIFEAPPGVRFEVIVVDDASTDSTPAMLAGYEAVTTVRLDPNAGFASACNAGAEAAKGRWLLFLNNDTIALPGWLDALAAYAHSHPKASVIGSKLLFPDGTVQHAGVVFSLSGDPLHIYAGCAADHPAVNKSRRFQAVTAACLMVKRKVFFDADGFDTGYFNDLEDVDLCLRLGQRGHEVHYCHESVLYHLESASRGYADKPSASAKVYRGRWGTHVKSDELDYYLEDGLLDMLRYSPELVRSDRGRRKKEAELLQTRSRQFAHLLREVVRLGTYTDEPPGDGQGNGAVSTSSAAVPARSGRLPMRVRRRIEKRLGALREELGEALQGDVVRAAVAERPAATEGDELPPYAEVVSELPALVCDVVPEGAIALVVSKGDEALVKLRGRRGWHFPRADDGRYAGYYPASSEEAIAHLEALRESGAEFLVVPSTHTWWMNFYTGLAQHLEERYETLVRARSGLVIDLRDQGLGVQRETTAIAPAMPETVRDSDDSPSDDGMGAVEYSDLVNRIRTVVDTVLPLHSTVLVVSRGDDDLLELAGRRAWHFPRADDGRYLGYHPADDDESIAHLEELRAKGAEYLVIPSVAFWWLDHYSGFAEHLRSRYSTVVYEHDACLIFELVERFLSDVVRALVPDDARIAVLSRHTGDTVGLDRSRTTATSPPGDEKDAVELVEHLQADGVEFLAIPHSSFGWLEENPGVREYLRREHRFVTHQQQACELYELSIGRPPPPTALEQSSTPADNEEAGSPGAGRGGLRSWLRRLFGGR
jgi:GT2 family glycosyltransferase